MEKKGKGSMCGKVAKSAPTEGASMSCEGKSTGKRKKIEEDRRRRSGACG